MSNSKISEDSLLAAVDIDGATDYVPVVDPSESAAGSRNKRSLLNTIGDWILTTYAGFVQSGSGAQTSTVDAALKKFVHTAQYDTTANFNTAQAALTGTLGFSRIQINDGSLASPGLSFGSDTDTGIYLGGAGSLRLVVGGALNVSTTTNGSFNVHHDDGSAALAFLPNNASTGSAHLTIRVTEGAGGGGLQLTRVTSDTGNVGIGFADGATQYWDLDLRPSSEGGNAGDLVLANATAANFRWVIGGFGGTDVLTWLGSTGELQLNGGTGGSNVNVPLRIANNKLLVWRNSADDANKVYIWGDASDNFNLGIDGATRLQVSSAGHVLPGATNSYDLGASGTVFRSLYWGTQALAPAGTASAPSYSFAAATAFGWFRSGSGQMTLGDSGSNVFSILSSNVQLMSSAVLAWSNTTDSTSTADLILARDAANVLAQRNSTTAQEHRIYTRYTSATDYGRRVVKWATTTLSAVSGASVTATGLIPARAQMLDGVISKVVTALGTTNSTTGYAVGTSGDPNLWGDVTGTAATTASGTTDFTASPNLAFSTSAQDVVVTAAGGNFDGTGAIYLAVPYSMSEAD